MASIHKKVGASGVESPFWQAKFKGLNGRAIWLTTKQTNHHKAMAVSDRWEECVELASRWELRNRTQKILDEVWKITKTPATQTDHQTAVKRFAPPTRLAKSLRAKTSRNFALIGSVVEKGTPRAIAAEQA